MNDERLLETSPRLHELRAAFARETANAPWPRATSADAAAALLVRAELDLLGVHQREIARILSRAVTWLERRAEGRRLAAFQKRAVGAVAAARQSGAWVPSAAERVAHARPTEWPSQLNLARSAFDLDPSAEHEALLARVQRGTET
jgi:hypothetical protein